MSSGKKRGCVTWPWSSLLRTLGRERSEGCFSYHTFTAGLYVQELTAGLYFPSCLVCFPEIREVIDPRRLSLTWFHHTALGSRCGRLTRPELQKPHLLGFSGSSPVMWKRNTRVSLTKPILEPPRPPCIGIISKQLIDADHVSLSEAPPLHRYRICFWLCSELLFRPGGGGSEQTKIASEPLVVWRVQDKKSSSGCEWRARSDDDEPRVALIRKQTFVFCVLCSHSGAPPREPPPLWIPLICLLFCCKTM